MIRSFADEATRDIFDGIRSKKARQRLDSKLIPIAQRKLDMIDAAIDLNDLRIPPSNHLEALKGSLKGKHSIRINDQYRIVFRWTMSGAEEVIPKKFQNLDLGNVKAPAIERSQVG